MKLQMKTRRGIQEIETGNKNMDKILTQMNMSNLNRYGFCVWGRFKLLRYDAEIIDNKLYINSKHRHNGKIVFDILAMYNTFQKNIFITQHSYEETLFQMLTIALENRLPTLQECERCHNV